MLVSRVLGGARVYINIGVGMGGGGGWVKSLTSSATLGPAHSHPPSQHISHKLGMYEFVPAWFACFHTQVYMCHIPLYYIYICIFDA